MARVEFEWLVHSLACIPVNNLFGYEREREPSQASESDITIRGLVNLTWTIFSYPASATGLSGSAKTAERYHLEGTLLRGVAWRDAIFGGPSEILGWGVCDWLGRLLICGAWIREEGETCWLARAFGWTNDINLRTDRTDFNGGYACAALHYSTCGR